MQKKCDSPVEYIRPNLFNTLMYITFQVQNIECTYSALYFVHHNLYAFSTDTGEVEKLGPTHGDRRKRLCLQERKGRVETNTRSEAATSGPFRRSRIPARSPDSNSKGQESPLGEEDEV